MLGPHVATKRPYHPGQNYYKQFPETTAFVIFVCFYCIQMESVCLTMTELLASKHYFM